MDASSKNTRQNTKDNLYKWIKEFALYAEDNFGYAFKDRYFKIEMDNARKQIVLSFRTDAENIHASAELSASFISDDILLRFRLDKNSDIHSNDWSMLNPSLGFKHNNKYNLDEIKSLIVSYIKKPGE